MLILLFQNTKSTAMYENFLFVNKNASKNYSGYGFRNKKSSLRIFIKNTWALKTKIKHCKSFYGIQETRKQNNCWEELLRTKIMNIKYFQQFLQSKKRKEIGYAQYVQKHANWTQMWQFGIILREFLKYVIKQKINFFQRNSRSIF